ncbi:hypothetical protein C1642_05960 [Acinetobacter sp. AKBS16]|nr:hypothetical protein C1642_05960 [Acinetobacter sp. AKBS16]
MDVQSQLLFIGSSAKIFKLWWQNERGFADWKQRNQHTRGVPLPPYRREKGGERVPAKNSIPPSCSQAHKMTFDLN